MVINFIFIETKGELIRFIAFAASVKVLTLCYSSYLYLSNSSCKDMIS